MSRYSLSNIYFGTQRLNGSKFIRANIILVCVKRNITNADNVDHHLGTLCHRLESTQSMETDTTVKRCEKSSKK